MNTAELTGALLDYWAAKAEEVWKTEHKMHTTWALDATFSEVIISEGKCILMPHNPLRQEQKFYSPSTDWAQGGPIIEREKISVIDSGSAGWNADIFSKTGGWGGPTALIAAMRCFVASKFGDEVPDE